MKHLCTTCRGTGRDYDQPDALGAGGGWLDTCPECGGSGTIEVVLYSNEEVPFFNPALNGILTITDDNLYVLSRPLTRSEMLDALHYCQDGRASCLFTLKLFEAHWDKIVERIP